MLRVEIFTLSFVNRLKYFIFFPCFQATLHIFGFMVVTCFINFWLIFAAIPFAGIFVIAMFYGFCTWNGLFMLTESGEFLY